MIVPTTLLHRDPRAYADPTASSSAAGPALRRAASHFPFGGGVRRCVGEPLAHAEIETVVPAVLETLALAPLAGEPEPMVQRATVLVPKRGLLVRAA